MRTTRFLLWLVMAPLAIPAAVAGQSGSLVLEEVAVVDVAGGAVQANLTVVINGRTIAAMGPAGTVALPAGATRVDGRGKYLIPGLWDAHVHVGAMGDEGKVFLPLLVANGVLSARDTHSQLERVVGLKRAIAAGTQVGPRLFVAGELIDGLNSVNPSARKVETEAAAREQVRVLQSGGADFIKVYSALPRDLYFAIAGEAKRLGIPFAGHVPPTVTASEASDAGQRTFEHLIGVEIGASRDEDPIRTEQVEAGKTKEFRWPDAARLKATRDPAKARALFERLRRNGTWQVPTLIVHRQIGSLADGTAGPDSLLRYVPKPIREFWKFPMGRFATDVRALYPIYRELVGDLYRAGVPILAGTDFPNPFVFPGFSLHEELALLVEAGLPPAVALRAATLDPARFLGVADSLGTIEVGKVADLVLLDADPLAAIANTRRIASVVQGGRLLDRAMLDRLLITAAELAR